MQAEPSSAPAPLAQDAAEAERQLAAAAARHREVVASLGEPGRPAAGRHVAAKAVARAVQLVTFALHRADRSGVPAARLSELTGWEPELVATALAESPAPDFVRRLVPAGIAPEELAEASAGLEAAVRLRALVERVLADVAAEDWAPAPADLDDLRERLDHEWRVWRRELGRIQEPPA
jgi:hypothetical protein